jgi:hypothetical protein
MHNHVWVGALILFMLVACHTQIGTGRASAQTDQQLSLTSIYYRPFDLGGRQHGEPDSVLLAEMANIQPTMITHIVHNGDPSGYASLIASLQALASHPVICFAIGDSAWSFSNPSDYSNMIAIAQNYVHYTNCLNVNPFDVMESSGSEADARRFLTDLHNMGFQHLIANAWITPPSGQPWPYVDAMEQSLSIPKQQGKPWFVAPLWSCCNTNPEERSKTIQDYHAQAANVVIIANYENPPGQDALTADGPQGSINDMTVGANGQRSSSPVPYRWMPAWSTNYDPYALGTLRWIENELATVDPTSTSTQGSTSAVPASTTSSESATVTQTLTSTTETAITSSQTVTTGGSTLTETFASTSAIIVTITQVFTTATERIRITSATTSLTQSSVPTFPYESIPGFPLESILAGIILGLLALVTARRWKSPLD